MVAGTLSSSTPPTILADTVRWRRGEATMRMGGDQGCSAAFAPPLVMGRRGERGGAAGKAGGRAGGGLGKGPPGRRAWRGEPPLGTGGCPGQGSPGRGP